mmetsp:Transcript_60823/g.137053  ORF Transcript_60823/g.137053 Transcript_60823/m.137053 type:complete len:230 (+) Transcript_60823:764-1453(+)
MGKEEPRRPRPPKLYIEQIHEREQESDAKFELLEKCSKEEHQGAPGQDGVQEKRHPERNEHHIPRPLMCTKSCYLKDAPQALHVVFRPQDHHTLRLPQHITKGSNTLLFELFVPLMYAESVQEDHGSRARQDRVTYCNNGHGGESWHQRPYAESHREAKDLAAVRAQQKAKQTHHAKHKSRDQDRVIPMVVVCHGCPLPYSTCAPGMADEMVYSLPLLRQTIQCLCLHF